MGSERTETRKPDEFLQKSGNLDQLFADIGLPLAELGQTAIQRHMEVVTTDPIQPKTHQQQAAEYFGKIMFPSPLR